MSTWNSCKLPSWSSPQPLWHRIILFWHIRNIKGNLMPIWKVHFCQLLPPPAAKLHWLQAVQLPHTADAKRESELPVPLQVAGLGRSQDLREDVLAATHSSQNSDFQRCYLYLLLFYFFWSSTVRGWWGKLSLSWKWQQNMLILLPLPFMFFLASPELTCCLHAVISRKRPELRGKWCHLSKAGSPQPWLSLSTHP